MKKELLKKFYLLQDGIKKTEREIFNPKYFEWNGFTWFDSIRDNFDSLYKEFDAEEYSILESLESIVNRKGYWDTELLTEEHKKKFSVDGSAFGVVDCIIMNQEFYETCKYCFIPLKTIDEALDFMQEKWWIE
jgi:hypothetical protein